MSYTATAPLRSPLAGGLELDVNVNGVPDIVIAPSYEEGGHEQHNAVAQAATSVFGGDVIHYLTYTREGGRSRDGYLVKPDDPEWIALKLRALACYRSQLRIENCRPWFTDLLDLNEWLA